MRSYKEYEKKYIGMSDIANLILAGSSDNGLRLTALHFGMDNDYYAYIVDSDAEIGEHYTKVAEFKGWLRIYDDSFLTHEGYPRGDFSFEEQTLHKKKTGEYFVYASGGAQSNFGDCYGGHDCSGEKFIPMSVEQAQQWSEEYLTVEKYVEIWGEPEE